MRRRPGVASAIALRAPRAPPSPFPPYNAGGDTPRRRSVAVVYSPWRGGGPYRHLLVVNAWVPSWVPLIRLGFLAFGSPFPLMRFCSGPDLGSALGSSGFLLPFRRLLCFSCWSSPSSCGTACPSHTKNLKATWEPEHISIHVPSLLKANDPRLQEAENRRTLDAARTQTPEAPTQNAMVPAIVTKIAELKTKVNTLKGELKETQGLLKRERKKLQKLKKRLSLRNFHWEPRPCLRWRGGAQAWAGSEVCRCG